MALRLNTISRGKHYHRLDVLELARPKVKLCGGKGLPIVIGHIDKTGMPQKLNSFG